MVTLIKQFDDILEKISKWSLVFCLLLILFLSVLSIILRWLGSSLLWLEPLVRHLVFLSAFLGGSLATSKGVHIKIDLLTHLIDKSQSKILKWFHKNLVSLFCFVTTLFLLKSGLDFYSIEKEFAGEAFLNLKSSTLVGIIPFGLALISLRFLNVFLLGVFRGDHVEHSRL
jgi:TRAP-type C4-dicarboxylate transport system permease small subunit